MNVDLHKAAILYQYPSSIVYIKLLNKIIQSSFDSIYFRFGSIFPSVQSSIKKREQSLQVRMKNKKTNVGIHVIHDYKPCFHDCCGYARLLSVLTWILNIVR